MPLVEEINPNAPRRPAAPAGSGNTPSGAPSGVGVPPGEDLPPEVAEAMAQMDEWRAADPEGFEAMMAATLASKQVRGSSYRIDFNDWSFFCIPRS
jgi:hypothetical protein